MAGRLFTLCLVLGLALASALAAPAVQNRSQCTNPKQRRAWHTLSDDDKRAYLDAVRCLMDTPGTLGLRGAKTKFDEMQSCHVSQAEIAHYVGTFLPFHRYLMWTYEHILQTECGYTGAQPYWQEQLDSGNFHSADIFTADVSFGGNGTGPNQCVPDGPFAGYMNSLGPGYTIGDHCINRNMDESISADTSQDRVDECLTQTSFIAVWHCIEGYPHYGGHGGVGGEMMNPISSPGDPIFFLHHTWLDKQWWEWQSQDLGTRLTEIGGPNRIIRNADGTLPGGGRFEERPADVPAPVIEGDPGDEVTLNHVISMYGIVDSITVREVMDIRETLCYEYIDP